MSSSNKPPAKTYSPNVEGLIEALFDELRDLKSGASAPHEAIAFSKLAGNIIGAMGVQLRREWLDLQPKLPTRGSEPRAITSQH